MTRGERKVHLLLRFSDGLYRTGNVIERHEEVLDRYGAVWWGKLGRAIGSERLERLETQANSGFATYLFLVQRKGRRYEVFRGDAVAFRAALPRDEAELVPSYYQPLGLDERASTWIKLENLGPAPPDGLQNYVVASSGAPVLQTLGRSMAAMFLIERVGTRAAVT